MGWEGIIPPLEIFYIMSGTGVLGIAGHTQLLKGLYVPVGKRDKIQWLLEFKGKLTFKEMF